MGYYSRCPEAFVSDLVSDLKKELPEFQAVENRIMDNIAFRWGLRGKIPYVVHVADKAIVRDEIVNMKHVPMDWNVPRHGIGANIQCWNPKRAEQEFLNRCHQVGIY